MANVLRKVNRFRGDKEKTDVQDPYDIPVADMEQTAVILITPIEKPPVKSGELVMRDPEVLDRFELVTELRDVFEGLTREPIHDVPEFELEPTPDATPQRTTARRFDREKTE